MRHSVRRLIRATRRELAPFQQTTEYRGTNILQQYSLQSMSMLASSWRVAAYTRNKETGSDRTFLRNVDRRCHHCSYRCCHPSLQIDPTKHFDFFKAPVPVNDACWLMYWSSVCDIYQGSLILNQGTVRDMQSFSLIGLLLCHLYRPLAALDG